MNDKYRQIKINNNDRGFLCKFIARKGDQDITKQGFSNSDLQQPLHTKKFFFQDMQNL